MPTITTVPGCEPRLSDPPSTAANSNPAAGGVTWPGEAVADGVGEELGVAGRVGEELGVAGGVLTAAAVGWIEECAMVPEGLPHAVRISTSAKSARFT
jgi:hypothetical protein